MSTQIGICHVYTYGRVVDNPQDNCCQINQKDDDAADENETVADDQLDQPDGLRTSL